MFSTLDPNPSPVPHVRDTWLCSLGHLRLGEGRCFVHLCLGHVMWATPPPKKKLIAPPRPPPLPKRPKGASGQQSVWGAPSHQNRGAPPPPRGQRCKEERHSPERAQFLKPSMGGVVEQVQCSGGARGTSHGPAGEDVHAMAPRGNGVCGTCSHGFVRPRGRGRWGTRMWAVGCTDAAPAQHCPRHRRVGGPTVARWGPAVGV